MMKLDCKVVRDMYPLYMDDDLSPEVKSAVDWHIERCATCSIAYRGGNTPKFKDLLADLDKGETPEPPETLLSRLTLRLLVTRVVLGIVLAVLLFTTMTHYGQLRYQLYRKAEEIAHSIHFESGMPDMPRLLHALSSLERYLSRGELKSYEVILPREIEPFLWLLDERKKSGVFSEADETALGSFRWAMLGVRSVLDSFFHNYARRGLTKPLARLNTELLSKQLMYAQEVALSYYLYNEHLSAHSINRAEEGLFLFPGFRAKVHGTDLSFAGEIPSGGRFDFQVYEENDILYRGKVNAYTGMVEEMTLVRRKLKETMELQKIEKKVDVLLRPLGWDFAVEYLGLIDDDRVYLGPGLNCTHTFRVVPIVKGWPYSEGALRIYYLPDGKLAAIRADRENMPLLWPDDVDAEVKIGQEQAMQHWISNRELFRFDPKGYSYVETCIIRSMVRGEYVLVHAYRQVVDSRGGESWVLLNVETGEEEMSVWQSPYAHRIRRP